MDKIELERKSDLELQDNAPAGLVAIYIVPWEAYRSASRATQVLQPVGELFTA